MSCKSNYPTTIVSTTYRPTPFSPVHKHLKFSAVFGTMSARNSISIRPLDEPPIVMSKKTTGLSAIFALLVVMFARSMAEAGGIVALRLSS